MIYRKKNNARPNFCLGTRSYSTCMCTMSLDPWTPGPSGGLAPWTPLGLPP